MSKSVAVGPMTVKHVATVEVTPDHQVTLRLPEDFPPDQAQVTVVTSTSSAKASPFGELLESEFLGMWAEREDIIDSAAYAVELQQRISSGGA